MLTMIMFWREVSAKEQYKSTIWELPGFCLRYVKTDFMHIVCLGILQYLQGNVLHELFKTMGGDFQKP